jgi:hypothetical protein
MRVMDADSPSGQHAEPGDDGSADVPPTLPSRTAFLTAFLSVLVAGIFGGIIGYGLVDLDCDGECGTEKLVGTVVGTAIGAIGVGVVAVLVLRAMSEWRRPGDGAVRRRPS